MILSLFILGLSVTFLSYYKSYDLSTFSYIKITILEPTIFIILTVFTFLVSLLLGHATSNVVLKVAQKYLKKEIRNTIGENPFFNVALGLFYIVVYAIILSIFSFFDHLGIIIIVILLVAIEAYTILRKIRYKNDLLRFLRRIFEKSKYKYDLTFLYGLFLISILLHYLPSVQAYNYPGGDDKAYLFLSKQIIEQKSVFISINYPFTKPYFNHNLIFAFSSIVTFFYKILQLFGLIVALPLLHLFFIIFYISLTPINFYIYTEKITKNKSFSAIIALTALFMWNSKTFYIVWGGIGEFLGYFLIPILALIDYELNQDIIDKGTCSMFIITLLIKATLFSIVFTIHPLSFLLFISLISIVNPLISIQNTYPDECIKYKIKLFIKLNMPILIFILGSIQYIFLAKVFLDFLEKEVYAVNIIFSIMVEGFNPEKLMAHPVHKKAQPRWLFLRFSRGADYALVKLKEILEHYYGTWIIIFMMMYILYICYWNIVKKEHRKDENMKKILNIVNAEAIVIVFLFLFSQNSPYGWYYIPYPFARMFVAQREYYVINVPVLYIEALPIYILYICFKKIKKIVLKLKPTRKIIIKIDSKSEGDEKIVKILAIVAICTLITNLYPIFNVYKRYERAIKTSIITKDDLKAFEWIESNTSKNSIFFVNAAGAGSFIYIYTGRKVLPPQALRIWTEEEYSEDFSNLTDMLQNGLINKQTIQLLNKYGVDYVYLGAKNLPYLYSSFDRDSIIQSKYFKVLFQYGEAYILKVSYQDSQH